MQRIFRAVREKVEKLFADGIADRVIGWSTGEFFYDLTPTVFNSADELKNFVYSGFSGANLSKYLIKESEKEGKVAVLLKPCDTYSFNQLLKEHRINREKIHTVGIPCPGMLDINKIRDAGIKGVTGMSEEGSILKLTTIYGESEIERDKVLLDRCLTCKGHDFAKDSCDEVVETDYEVSIPNSDRFELVQKLEAMTAEERNEFWSNEFSKCIRCYACRNVCPACNCIKCIFDNDNSGVAAKANDNPSEENFFHIIRAFHVAGRCTDCGECSRVCPQHIPLHLLNRKFIKDINEFYGEYQAGEDATARGPLTDFTKGDVEPHIVTDGKGGTK